MNKNKLYAFYGSLRPGMYNANHFQKTYGAFDIIKENHVVKGYKMYSLGAYPYCVQTDDENDEIIVTLVRLTNDRQEAVIDGMEKGASYYYDEVVTDVTVGEDKNASFGIYLFPESYSNKEVPNGDWPTFYNEARSEKVMVN